MNYLDRAALLALGIDEPLCEGTTAAPLSKRNGWGNCWRCFGGRNLNYDHHHI